ncbi:efflux transporter outer membrane subunit [Pantoea sp. 1.19]|uniref:efflux transporter outer membrane subunit n=1 Tax=Pantoea sp. 1.19 TaxID=1925589 RepID=UPI000948CCDF|nr:efflux transporter outer membrane subunit [Pantoea sp. 1.19]
MQVTQTLSLLTLALLLGGCAVGPDYRAPDSPLPYRWQALDATAASRPTAGQPQTQWWRSFNDPQLNRLMGRAITGNLSLQQTVLRIAGAREQLAQARGGYLPSVQGNVGYTRQQLGLKGELESQGVYQRANEVNPALGEALDGLTKPVNLYQGSFDAAWELDLWGKVRRQVEAADAQTRAAIEQRNDALVSLEAEVVRAWLQLRGAQAIRQTLQQQINSAQQTVELTRSQQQNGLTPQMNVENARAQLSGLQAQLPPLEAQIQQAMNGLALLLGQPPGALDAELRGDKPLPALPQAVPVGIPSTLARRRPDIRRAEAELHAATANIGVSVAQLFPSLSLTGQFGLRNTEADSLTHWSSHFYSVGPSLTIPIFQGGRLVSSVKVARAQQASAVLQYRQTVLTGLQEVENALVSYRTDQQQVARLEESVASLQQTFSLANDNYREGNSSFIDVLSVQRQLAQSAQQLASARMQTGLDLVALYKALGGGWEPFQQVTLPDYNVFGPAPTG